MSSSHTKRLILFRAERRQGSISYAFVFVILAIQPMSLSHAQITTDGTVGLAKTLHGSAYVISPELGRQVGNTLFHSFGKFSLQNGESATFTGPESIDHVLARVTGGTRSIIDGLIQTTIPGYPSFWLINPAGITFGKHGRLDVGGSFHTSTADFLRLEDGVRFNAIPSAEDAMLTSAAPSAFGFLAKNPATLVVNGSELEVKAGQTLSLVGGGLVIDKALLKAPAGQLQLAGVASPQEVTATADGLLMDPQSLRGTITVSGRLFNRPGETNLSGRHVIIRGGRFVLEEADIRAEADIDIQTQGDNSKQGIDIGVDELIMRNGQILNPTFISDAGSISIAVNGSVLLEGSSSIFTETFGTGNAGDIAITAKDSITLKNQSFISSDVLFDTGNAGTITVNAGDSIVLDNISVISSRSFGQGDAGNIAVAINQLRLSNRSVISTQAVQSGGGSIEIRSRDLVTLAGSEITTDVAAGDENAGNIIIRQPVALTLVQNSRIAADAFEGRGGNIDIGADVLISDRSLEDAITASSERGVSGEISITSPEVDIASSLTALPAAFFDASAVLPTPCAARSGADISQLTTRHSDVLPDSPHALRTHVPVLAGAAGAAGRAPAPAHGRLAHFPRLLMNGCGHND